MNLKAFWGILIVNPFFGATIRTDGQTNSKIEFCDLQYLTFVIPFKFFCIYGSSKRYTMQILPQRMEIQKNGILL